MSVFSEKLGQLAKKKDIKMYQIAEFCGLDRSTVYKYWKGTRSVKSLEVVAQFAEALQLDPSQTDELVAAYQITYMGDENYLRRKKVLEFFNSFCPNFRESEGTVRVVPQTAADEMIFPKGCGVCEREEQVDAMIHTVLSAELARPNGSIQMMVQPEYQFPFQMLRAEIQADSCQIQHILCLENAASPDTTLYNLDSLKVVTEVLLAQRGYTPFYFYDSVGAHFRNNMLLPYLFITSTCAIQISYDRREAIYYSDKEHLACFHKMFDAALKRSTPMVKRLDSIEESLSFYFKKYAQEEWAQSGCNAEPCLTSCLDRDILEKYAKQIDRRDELIDLFSHYISTQTRNTLKQKFTEYFSSEGLDYFCRTGHIWQIPAFAVAPLEPADRYELLRRFRDSRASTDTFMLKKESPLSLGKMEAMVWRKGQASFVYEHSPNQYTTFLLLEKSLSLAFADLFTYIQESNMAYNNKESMHYIQVKMDEIKRGMISSRQKSALTQMKY